MSEHFDTISRLIELRRYDLARNELSQAIKNDPSDADLYHLSAYLHWLRDETEQGIEVAHQGLALDPHHEGLRYNLFNLLEENREYAEAEQVIIELIRENPRDVDYLRGYAQLMLFTFHLPKAEKLVHEALRIAPDDANSRILAILIDISRGKITDSEHTLAELVRDHPDSEHVARILLISLIEKKKFRAAQHLAQELLRNNPDDPNLVEAIVELRSATHWSAWPVWPLTRFGWPAAIGMWLGFIGLRRLDDVLHFSWFGYVVWIYLGWCVYTWIHGPIIKRWLNYRGV